MRGHTTRGRGVGTSGQVVQSCGEGMLSGVKSRPVRRHRGMGDGRGIYGKLGRFGGDCDSVTVGRRNGLQEPATCQPAPGRCMCRRSKSDCDDCFRREDAAIAMQPGLPTVGVGVQQVARRWRSSRRRRGWPPDLPGPSPTSLARCSCALRNLCCPLCPSMALCAALVLFSLVGHNTNTNTVSALSGSLPASARPACMNTHVVCHRPPIRA
jgi:hypothetical protein